MTILKNQKQPKPHPKQNQNIKPNYKINEIS